MSTERILRVMGTCVRAGLTNRLYFGYRSWMSHQKRKVPRLYSAAEEIAASQTSLGMTTVFKAELSS